MVGLSEGQSLAYQVLGDVGGEHLRHEDGSQAMLYGGHRGDNPWGKRHAGEGG